MPLSYSKLSTTPNERGKPTYSRPLGGRYRALIEAAEWQVLASALPRPMGKPVLTEADRLHIAVQTRNHGLGPGNPIRACDLRAFQYKLRAGRGLGPALRNMHQAVYDSPDGFCGVRRATCAPSCPRRPKARSGHLRIRPANRDGLPRSRQTLSSCQTPLDQSIPKFLAQNVFQHFSSGVERN